MTRRMLIAWLAVLVTGCAAQNAPAPVSSPPPSNPVSPPPLAPGVELLGEMSGSTPGATAPAPSRPCNLDHCGVIVAITHHRGKVRLPPGQVPGPSDTPVVYYTSEVGLETTVTEITEIWEIRVRMRDGKIRAIRQDYQPFLQVGNPVVVEGSNLRLWN